MESRCPVCGFAPLYEPAWGEHGASYEICPCCWIEFGYDDHARGSLEGRRQIHAQWRSLWIAQGMPWRSPNRPPPADWNARRQLAAIGVDAGDPP